MADRRSMAIIIENKNVPILRHTVVTTC